MSYQTFTSAVWVVVIAVLTGVVCLVYWLHHRDGSFRRIRWEYDTVYERVDCPCCGGSMGHVLGDETTHVQKYLDRGHYQIANWLPCTICGSTGFVGRSAYSSYKHVKPGQCISRS
jgi:hypothetical protein